MAVYYKGLVKKFLLLAIFPDTLSIPIKNLKFEFQFHTNTHIRLWLSVVPTLEQHSCVARASEIPVE